MFGFYRTMLALWVMIFHLLTVPLIGQYAVFSFYTLSGFLMTTIIHESYGYDKNGIKRYIVNRFLRLYPIYWMVILFSIIVIFIVSEEYSNNYCHGLYIPHSTSEILFNISMIFPSLFPFNFVPRLSPPTWSLTVEIFFYACIALGISKTRKITLIWSALSIIYFIFSYIIGLHSSHRYVSIFAASLPFSLGSLLFFYKSEVFHIINQLKISSPIILLSIYVLNATVFILLRARYSSFNYIGEIGKYTNLLLSLLVISSLFYKGGEIFNYKLDKAVGDYSYPIYLLHYPCGVVASFILYKSPNRELSIEGIISFLLALFFALVISFILIQLVDKNLSLVRSRIKANKI